MSNIVNEVLRLITSIQRGQRSFYSNMHPNKLNTTSKIMLDCPEKPVGYDLDVHPNGMLEKICLASGGADSTIFWFKEDKPKALYIDIGQAYASKEMDALTVLGVPYETVYFFDDLKEPRQDWKHIIPGRNFLFLTVAAERLESGGTILFSVISGEGYESKKGDKSKKFINHWKSWYHSVTGKDIFVQTMVERTKGQWLEWFMGNGYDINLIRHVTVTCFSSGNTQCGKCQACLRKFLSFVHVGINTIDDYEINPMVGGKEYVEKYLKVLPDALRARNFSHYSEARCLEDISAMAVAEGWK